MFVSSVRDPALYPRLLICDMNSELLALVRDLKHVIQTLDHRPRRAASCSFLVYFDFLFISGARKLQCCSCALTASCLSKKPLLCSQVPTPSTSAICCSVVKTEVLCCVNVLPPAELSLIGLSERCSHLSLVFSTAERAVSEWLKKCSSVLVVQLDCANEQSCYHHVLWTLEVSTNSTLLRSNLKPWLCIVKINSRLYKIHCNAVDLFFCQL